jgi:hypothetical protein
VNISRLLTDNNIALEAKKEKELFIMDMNNKQKNDCIRCTVSQCKYNMVTEDYCSLGCISVGTHESNPTVPECTDCNSFVKRTGCC